MKSTTYVTRDTLSMYSHDNDGPGPELMGADTLLGNDVYNGADEDLGDIKEFMIDMASGKVAYAVLSFGGILGMGDKLFAVPFSALKLDTANKRFTLDVSKDAMKDAPGFDKDKWPRMADATWAHGVHAFYGTQIDERVNPGMSGTSVADDAVMGNTRQDGLRSPTSLL